MVAHTSRRPDRTDVEPHRVSWRRRLIWLLALLAAAAAAAVAGIVLAEQLTPSSSGPSAAHRGPTADSREIPGATANRASSSVTSSSVTSQARSRPGQEYSWRPAYVRGKVVFIRIRADAANVREDRGISK